MSVELPSIKFLRSPQKLHEMSYLESIADSDLNQEDSQLLRINQISPLRSGRGTTQEEEWKDTKIWINKDLGGIQSSHEMSQTEITE